MACSSVMLPSAGTGRVISSNGVVDGSSTNTGSAARAVSAGFDQHGRAGHHQQRGVAQQQVQQRRRVRPVDGPVAQRLHLGGGDRLEVVDRQRRAAVGVGWGDERHGQLEHLVGEEDAVPRPRARRIRVGVGRVGEVRDAAVVVVALPGHRHRRGHGAVIADAGERDAEEDRAGVAGEPAHRVRRLRQDRVELRADVAGRRRAAGTVVAAAARHAGSIVRSVSATGSVPASAPPRQRAHREQPVRLVADEQGAQRPVRADARRRTAAGPGDELGVGRGGLHRVEEVLERHLPHAPRASPRSPARCRRRHRRRRNTSPIPSAVASRARSLLAPAASPVATGTPGSAPPACCSSASRVEQGRRRRAGREREQLFERGVARWPRRRASRTPNTTRRVSAAADRPGHLLADAEADRLGRGEVGLPADGRGVAGRADGHRGRDRRAARSGTPAGRRRRRRRRTASAARWPRPTATASSFGSAIGTSGNVASPRRGVSSRRRYWARTSPNSCTKRFHAASVVRASSPSARRDPPVGNGLVALDRVDPRPVDVRCAAATGRCGRAAR